MAEPDQCPPAPPTAAAASTTVVAGFNVAHTRGVPPGSSGTGGQQVRNDPTFKNPHQHCDQQRQKRVRATSSSSPPPGNMATTAPATRVAGGALTPNRSRRRFDLMRSRRFGRPSSTIRSSSSASWRASSMLRRFPMRRTRLETRPAHAGHPEGTPVGPSARRRCFVDAARASHTRLRSTRRSQLPHV